MSDETNEQVPKWLIFGADVAQTADGEPSPSLDRILEQIGPEPSWRRTPALEGPGSEGLTEAASGGRPKQNGKGQSYYAEMAERKAVSAALILRELGLDAEQADAEVRRLRPNALKLPVHIDYLAARDGRRTQQEHPQ